MPHTHDDPGEERKVRPTWPTFACLGGSELIVLNPYPKLNLIMDSHSYGFPFCEAFQGA